METYKNLKLHNGEDQDFYYQKNKSGTKYVYVLPIVALVLFIIIGIVSIVTPIERLETRKIWNRTFNFQMKNKEKIINDPRLKSMQSNVCHSYIPFSFDISTKLTSQQFASMKSFILNPFLSTIFPVNIQPALFSTYSEQNHSYRRPSNVSGIVNFVTSVPQGSLTNSFITKPLQYFTEQNVINLGSNDRLSVNTIIFAGNSLATADIQTVKNYASILTANRNTLTVILVNPNIDQTNYRQVPGLNIVVWSDAATTIAAIRNVINCGQQPSSATSTTTTTSISSTSSSHHSSTPPSWSSTSPTTTSAPTTSITTTSAPTTSITTTSAPTTSTTTTQPTTTHTYPRPIDIAVIFDGSVCSNEGNLGEQLNILEKIFSEYTFGINVRVAFAKPINMGVEFITSFVCDMASINSTIQSFNQYCEVSAFLNPEQHLNDSMLGAMNVLYNQHSPALVFIVLLQSNGSSFANETTSVVNSAKYIRQTCLEPTNTKVVVVQVDNFYVVDPELASDGFFFNNTEDIGHHIGVALENVANYNAGAYTCAPATVKNLIPNPKDSSSCYANP